MKVAHVPSTLRGTQQAFISFMDPFSTCSSSAMYTPGLLLSDGSQQRTDRQRSLPLPELLF